MDKMDPLLNSRAVRTQLGGISETTLWRWVRANKFPAPIKISDRNYWRQSVVAGWPPPPIGT